MKTKNLTQKTENTRMNVMLRSFLSVFVLLLGSQGLGANSVIEVSFKHAPQAIIEAVKKELNPEEMQKLPQNIDKECKPNLNSTPVIAAARYTYPKDGLARLPLSWASEKVYLVISPSIKLITLQGETKNHAELDLMANTKATLDPQARIYLCERKKKQAPTTGASDSKSNPEISYWSITEKTIPTKLSPLSVVIIADPKNLVVQKGEFMTDPGSHFILPPIFVVGASTSEVLSGFTDIKRYLEPVTEKTTVDAEKNIESSIIENQ